MDKEQIFFFRSTYFNSPVAKRIEPEWFYMTAPVKQIEKLTTEQLEDLLMHTYNQLFANPQSINKMKSDYQRYYYELDKRNFME